MFSKVGVDDLVKVLGLPESREEYRHPDGAYLKTRLYTFLSFLRKRYSSQSSNPDIQFDVIKREWSLFVAVNRGDIPGVRAALEKDVKLDRVHALEVVLRSDKGQPDPYLTMLKFLVETGQLDLQALSRVMGSAASFGCDHMVTYLGECGARVPESKLPFWVDQKQAASIAAMCAVGSKSGRVLNLNARAPNGLTLLYEAATGGDLAMAKVLVDNGALPGCVLDFV